MILDEIKNRFSVREYLDKDVSENDLNEILEAARLAPSACNYQPWKFIVVRDKNNKEALYYACKRQSFVREAPVIIVGCRIGTAFPMFKDSDSGILDVGIALTHMSLQAVKLNLGTCWIGAFYEDKVKEILSIPESATVVALLALGYPKNPVPPPKIRKKLSEIVSYEKYY